MAALKNLSESLGIGNRVHFGGVTPSEQFFNACDIFVLSSRWEGMPNVVMEAMAQGVPVAAAGTGGVTDLIEDGREGLLFPTRDADALAGAVARLAADPDLRKKLSSEAEKKIKDKFSMGSMIEAYSKLYERILSGR